MVFRLVKYGFAELPLMDVKYPPASTWLPTVSSVSTWPAALCANEVITAPVEVETAAMFFTAVPFTELNWPPRYATVQPELNAIELTMPFTFGFHDVTWNGEVAAKLNALFLA